MNYLLNVVTLATIIIMGYIGNRQLQVIHNLVNSTLTKAQADVELAQKRIEVLETHIANEQLG
jgi:hypothetical protein